MTIHRIDLASFSEGRAWCTCGTVIDTPSEPAFDRDERLELAWRDHRRAVGAPVRSVSNTIGKRLGGDPQRFSLHLKALR